MNLTECNRSERASTISTAAAKERKIRHVLFKAFMHGMEMKKGFKMGFEKISEFVKVLLRRELAGSGHMLRKQKQCNGFWLSWPLLA